jgi:hypothetical protein
MPEVALGEVTIEVNRECTRISANRVAGAGNAYARVPAHSRSLAFIRGFTPEQLPGEKDRQTSEQLGYGDPSNGEFKSLAVVLCFLRFLLFSPQKATKRTKEKGIGSARLEGPFGHFF